MEDDLNQSQQKILSTWETNIRKEMPEECVPLYKRFLYCKHSVGNYLKTTDPRLYKRLGTRIGDSIIGCTEEYKQFNNCNAPFLDSYNDLKNYVAMIENKPHNIVPGKDDIFKANNLSHSLKVSPIGIVDCGLY